MYNTVWMELKIALNLVNGREKKDLVGIVGLIQNDRILLVRESEIQMYLDS